MKRVLTILSIVVLTVTYYHDATVAAKPPVSGDEVPKRIAVLGASFTFMPVGKGWPMILNDFLQGFGVNAEIIATGSGGVGFSNIWTEYCYGDKTAAEQTVEVNPDVVLIEMGLGDAYVDGRTAAQIIADATTLRDYLKANLPNATLVYVSNPAHDQTNFPLAGPTVKRKAIIPHAGMTGLAQTTNEKAVLNDPLPTPVWTAMGEWISADASLRSMFDGYIQIDYWKIARAGGLSADNLHANQFGAYMTFQQVYKAIINSPKITQAVPGLGEMRMSGVIDFDEFWDSMFSRSGDDWIIRTGEWWVDLIHPKAAWDITVSPSDIFRGVYFWTNRQKPQWSILGNYPGSGQLTLDMSDLFPKQPMSVKFWASTSAEPAWTSAGTASSAGTFMHQFGTYFPIGTYHLKVKAGNDIFELDDVVF